MIDSSKWFEAVFFDFFGTLTTAVQRGPAHIPIARSLGCEPGTLSAALDRTFRIRASGRLGAPEDTLRALAAEQGARPGQEAVARAVTARVDAVLADVMLRRDALPVLQAVRRRGLRTAVISDCWYELPVLLPRLPVAPLLDTWVCSYDVGHCKPDPEIYQTACRRLGVEPARCLYVGDGGGRELTGARQFGITAVRLAAVDLGGHLAFDAEPDWDGPVVRTLTDLLALLPDPVRPVPAPTLPTRLLPAVPAPV